MTDTIIDSYTTDPITLVENDTLWVLPVGSIVTTEVDEPEQTGVAVTWDLSASADVPPGVVIVNEGQIASTDSRAIQTDGDPTGVLAFYLYNYGTIGSPADDALKIREDLNAGSVVFIENFGTIETTGTSDDTNGQALDLNDLETIGAEIINHEFGLITAAEADAIRPGNGGVVTNYGHILGGAVDLAFGNDGIDYQEWEDGTVVNYLGGRIEGTRHGITGDLKTVDIENHGDIIGQRGGGINIDLGEFVATETLARIINKGTIEGTAEGDQDGDGIDTDGLIDLDNYGTIRGLGTWDEGLSEAVTIGGGKIKNHADGVIYSVERAINVDDSDGGAAFAITEIINEGTIEAGNGEAIIIVGTFADIITNKGIILGDIATGGGDDAINLYTGATTGGIKDGGAGTADEINLEGDGTGTLADVMNVEVLNVNGGFWTLADFQAYGSGATIAEGAGLIVGAGGGLGGLEADVSIAFGGFLAVDRSEGLLFDSVISGDGVFEQRGTGATTLIQTNTYTGGTTLVAGVLELAAFEAAGTGNINFTDGAQILAIDDAALAPVDALVETSFGNTIVDFGEGDAIVLTELEFAAGATVDYDKTTDVMTVSSFGETVTLMVADPESNKFTAEKDSVSGTRIVLKDKGHKIGGTDDDDVIDATTTPFGRKLPTTSDDFIRGKKGDDKIAGLAGNDELKGGRGDDNIRAGAGNDIVAGGRDKNILKGGKGFDAFLFDTKLGDGKDAKAGSAFSFSRITDFNPNKDLFLLDQSIFTALSLGPLPASQFKKGKTAKDADDYILYKASEGAVYYDEDGVGGSDAVQFAKVDKHTDLTADNFLVV
ncbi:hypothetical protein [Bauldia sp.]|uniref:hypothetical protein n=1 Tax=Bauldia sp. TaxID=2575872 RepID=UPI003BAC73D1